MRVMVIVKATRDSEAGQLPSPELLSEMGQFNEQLVKAGVMLAAEGLQSSAQGVRVRQDKLKIDDPVDVLKDVSKTSPEREVACLESVVTLLETDIAPMQARAQAWALGDVAALRKLPYAADRTACLAAVSNSERVRALIARAQDDWLIAIEDSLSRNRGTLAVQSMDRLLGEHGALAVLRARGYTVAGP